MPDVIANRSVLGAVLLAGLLALQPAPGLAGSQHPSEVRVAVVDGLDLGADPFAGVDLGELGGKPDEPESAPPAADAEVLSPPSADATKLVPDGGLLTASVDNKGAVRNGASNPNYITPKTPIVVKSIRTYHWNNGRGQPPGQISIEGVDGRRYGPWAATGQPGQSGVPNAYWLVEPDVILEAGKYRIVDSDPATWATNAIANGHGFVAMTYQQLKPAPTQSAPMAAAESAAERPTTAAASEDTKTYGNPYMGEFRLDWCLKDGKNCGKPAADEFCRYWSMKEAVSFKKAEDVGRYGPTREILDGALCEKPTCDGFSEIICR